MTDPSGKPEGKLDLTVAVPTRNAIGTLRATLESLRPLRERGARIIVVDSESTDGTREVARLAADELRDCPPGSLYAAVNAGLRGASTGWVGYLNADDLVFGETLARAIVEQGDGADLLYGDLDYIDREGRFVHAAAMPPPADLLPLAAAGICGLSPIGTVYRREVFEELGGFDVRWRYSADFDFFARAALAGRVFRRITGGSVGAFRLHAAQISQQKGNPVGEDSRQIAAAHRWPVSPWQIRWARWRWRWRLLPSYLIRWLRVRARGGGLGRLGDCLDDGDPRTRAG